MLSFSHTLTSHSGQFLTRGCIPAIAMKWGSMILLYFFIALAVAIAVIEVAQRIHARRRD